MQKEVHIATPDVCHASAGGELCFDRPLHAAVARLTGGISPSALSQAYADWAQHLLFSPDKNLELMQQSVANWLRALDYCTRSCLDPDSHACVEPPPHDRRFTANAWHPWPFSAFAQAFLLTEGFWQQATTGIRGVSPHHEAVVSFVARQILDCLAPSNFLAANPELMERTVSEGGANLLRGTAHFWEDLRRIQLGEKPAGADKFQVGRDVAVTPGRVVARNRLIELIQYTPTTPDVYAEPILIVPAWIMKYYILDLSPENSLVKWLVDRGHTVFMISWKNPTRDDQDLSFDDYRRLGVMAALDVISRTCPDQKIHAAGYCLGGTLLSIVAAAMARDGDDRLASLTLLAAQVDFTEAGELMLFIDEAQVSFLEDMMATEGCLDTRQMAGAFQLLRSNDLIWSTMVRSYLAGERAPMIDLMAWNADATRMPARMHSEYLRKLFLNNALAGGHFDVGGRPVSLRDIRVPVFAVSTTSDHVAPWRSVYKIQALTDADVTFVLSNGGHNAGIVSPPGNANRKHQIATHREEQNYVDPDAWQLSAVHHDGSWWPCWQAWLTAHSSTQRVSARRDGRDVTTLGDAPGTYVLAP